MVVMKTIIGLLLLFFLGRSADAQKPAFFRIYNSNGKKVNKGVIFGLSDTSVTLTRRNMFVKTSVLQIDVIKSKRTTGHRVLKTTLTVVGAAVFLVATVYTLAHDRLRNGYINSGTNNHQRQSGNAKGPLHQTPRPQKKYKVHGDVEKWQEQRKLLLYQIVWLMPTLNEQYSENVVGSTKSPVASQQPKWALKFYYSQVWSK
jgi:hypothetical protein